MNDRSKPAASNEWSKITLSGDNRAAWHTIAGPWAQDDDGVMAPPQNLCDENLAFHVPHVYRDFEAEFEFRWDCHWTGPGFIFRAQDVCHFYLVEFPVTGQHSLGEAFWVMIARVDRSGWRHILSLQMVHGLSSAPNIWRKARLSVTGDEIRVWVDGRPLTPVHDGTYRGSGRIGLAAYTGLGATPKSSFRGLRVRGRPVASRSWDESIVPTRHWGVVDPEHGSACTNIVRAPNGDLFTYSAPKRHFRSTDNGLTWAHHPDTSFTIDSNVYRPRTRPDGKVERYVHRGELPFEISKQVSDDDGRTWSQARQVADVKFPDEMNVKSFYGSMLLESQAGSLLFFNWARPGHETKVYGGRLYQTATLPWSQSYVLRSTDGGETFSGPICIDGAGPGPIPEGYEPHVKDELNEVSAAQTRDGRILAMIRPVHSPWIWETWSEDDGQTWTPAARGPFPLYASGNAMITTSSGVIVIGGRFPGLTVQASYDDGMTWHGHRIDTGIWGNGAMIEIEPDLVLFIYGGWNHPMQMRYQTLKVTPGGLEPGPVIPFKD